jgi:hypothetical protein
MSNWSLAYNLRHELTYHQMAKQLGKEKPQVPCGPYAREIIKQTPRALLPGGEWSRKACPFGG